MLLKTLTLPPSLPVPLLIAAAVSQLPSSGCFLTCQFVRWMEMHDCVFAYNLSP